MQLKNITMEDAIERAMHEADDVYMIMRVNPATSLDELYRSDGFYLLEDEEEAAPKPEVKAPSGKIIDHGRICALYTANPPRSVQWIADDMKISVQTVINHLKKEGIYKK